MPKKKQSIDYIKLLPIGVMAVSLISGYTLLNARMAQAEEKLKSQEQWLISQTQSLTQSQVSQARIEEKVNAIYEAIKSLKNE